MGEDDMLGPEVGGFELPDLEFGGEESFKYFGALVMKVSRVLLEEKRKGGAGRKVRG